MKKIEFRITGKTPLLFNKFNIEVVTNKIKKSGSAGNDPEEWRNKVLVDGTKLYLSKDYIFGCISEGGAYIKDGRASMKKKLMGCLLISQDKFYLNRELPQEIQEMKTEELSKDTSNEIYLDVRAVKNPMTKGKNVRYRLALSPGWSTTVWAEWDDTIMSKETISQAVEYAGKFCGVGDGRLLGNGRFTVDEIKVT